MQAEGMLGDKINADFEDRKEAQGEIDEIIQTAFGDKDTLN